MSSAVEKHVVRRLADAAMCDRPFPHIYVDEIFPPDFYRTLRKHWPKASDLVTLASTGRVPDGAYPERFVMPLSPDHIMRLPAESRDVWTGLKDWMESAHFVMPLMDKFEPYLRKRFGSELERIEFGVNAVVVRDHTNYSLGPHTDSPHHVLALIFYCPDDDAFKHLGTSIYEPLNPDFRCAGGPSYHPSQFSKVATMEYRPNTLFAFFKTDKSFHGVERIADGGVLRDLLFFDVFVVSDPAKPIE